MQTYFLKTPLYREPNHSSVLLILENSITSRELRNDDKLIRVVNENILKSLNEFELKIVQYLMSNKTITLNKVMDLLTATYFSSKKHINNLMVKEIVEWHGSNKNDPTQYYSLKIKQ